MQFTATLISAPFPLACTGDTHETVSVRSVSVCDNVCVCLSVCVCVERKEGQLGLYDSLTFVMQNEGETAALTA